MKNLINKMNQANATIQTKDIFAVEHAGKRAIVEMMDGGVIIVESTLESMGDIKVKLWVGGKVLAHSYVYESTAYNAYKKLLETIQRAKVQLVADLELEFMGVK